MIIPFKYRVDVPIANNLANKLAHYAQDMHTNEEAVIVEALRVYLESDQFRLTQAPTVTSSQIPRK